MTVVDVSMVSFPTACCLYIVSLYARVCYEWIVISYMTILEPSGAVVEPGTLGLGQSNPALIQL